MLGLMLGLRLGLLLKVKKKIPSNVDAGRGVLGCGHRNIHGL